MLLYVTLEEVLGGEPQRGEPRPLHTIPSTVAALYDLGMRQHVRKRVLLHWQDDRLEETPDWRLDRLVIRIALYARERLQLVPGDCVAVFGPLHWLWPATDFAALGLGAVAVGLPHDLADDALVYALAEAAPRVVVTTDATSAARLVRLRATAGAPEHLIVPEAMDASGTHPLGGVLELGGTLDTPEGAQSFRTASRSQAPQAAALWHFAPAGAGNGSGFLRLTHGEAMARLSDRLKDHPAREGDVAYLEGPGVSLATRLGYCGYVGDGHTTTLLGRAGQASAEVAAARPHKLLASSAWLERTWAEIDGGPNGLLGRLARWSGAPALRALARRQPAFRRAIATRLGDRLRWIETVGPLRQDLVEALRQAGLEVATGS